MNPDASTDEDPDLPSTLRSVVTALEVLATNYGDPTLRTSIAALRNAADATDEAHVLPALYTTLQALTATAHESTREYPGIPNLPCVLVVVGERTQAYARVAGAVAGLLHGCAGVVEARDLDADADHTAEEMAS